MPNLKYLSIMGNNAAPSYLNGGSFYDYLQCRFVLMEDSLILAINCKVIEIL